MAKSATKRAAGSDERPQPNEHGVYVGDDVETIEVPLPKGLSATIQVVRVAADEWPSGHTFDCRSPYAGATSPPTGMGSGTKSHAIAKELRRLVEWLRGQTKLHPDNAKLARLVDRGITAVGDFAQQKGISVLVGVTPSNAKKPRKKPARKKARPAAEEPARNNACDACGDWFALEELAECPQCDRGQLCAACLAQPHPTMGDDTCAGTAAAAEPRETPSTLDEQLAADEAAVDAEHPSTLDSPPSTEPDVRTLSTAEIVPSATNPRKVLDEDGLRELADSLRTHGQLQNVRVRPREDGLFELISGERRWRAAKLAGIATLFAVVVDEDDEAVLAEEQFVENLQRKQLGPLEEARGLQALHARRGGTLEELARRLGVSRPWISNRLRLLELPEPVREHVASGALPATHAREVAAYAEVPEIVADVVESIDREGVGTVEEFRESVLDAVWNHSAGVDVAKHDRLLFESLDAETTKELDVREIETHGRTVRRVLNVELWDRLVQEHAAAEDRAADEAVGAEVDESPSGSSTLDPPPSTDEADKSADREKAKRRAERLEAKLKSYKLDWLRTLIACRFAENRPGTDEILDRIAWRLLVYYGFCAADLDEVARREQFAALQAARHGRGWRDRGEQREKAYAALTAIEFPESLAFDVLARWIEEGPLAACGLQPASIAALAKELQIEFAEEWEVDSDFLELHDKDGLKALVHEWSLDLDTNASKRDLVGAMLGRENLPCPKGLAKLQVDK